MLRESGMLQGRTVPAWVFLTVAPLFGGSFTNGSFEFGADPTQSLGTPKDGLFLTLYAGDPSATYIDGWTVVEGNILVLGDLPPSVDYVGPFWTPSDGLRSIDLDGDTQGAIEQTFDTTSNKYYQVQFDLAGNTNGSPPMKAMEVNVNNAGNTTEIYTFDSTGYTNTNMGWTTMYFDFLATGGSTTLMFKSLDAGQFGAAIDNVRLLGPFDTPIYTPEPGSLLLMGFGTLALAARHFRSRISS